MAILENTSRYARRLSSVVRRTLSALPGRGRGSPGAPPSGNPPGGTLDHYVRTAPSPQNALDIFAGEWFSLMPGSIAGLRAGHLPLFDDKRIHRVLSEIGGVRGKRVLELGPLEAGHSYMLDRSGAARVVAIEGNTRAFLKCLVVKELLGLPSVQFLCGDFVAHLRETHEQFDVCLASGVLYHVHNPAELIALLARHCVGHIYIWSHYYDRVLIDANPRTNFKFYGSRRETHLGFEHTLYLYDYERALEQRSFCGGGARTSCWMTREDIERALAFFGFDDVRVIDEELDHMNGPAIEIIAARSS